MPYLRRGFLKSAHRPNYLYCHIDAFPMLALTLVLLMMFLLASPYPHHGVTVDRVKSAHAHRVPAATKEDAIRVAVFRDGTVYVGTQRVEPDVLSNRIRDAVLNGAEKKVYLIVDARAQYGDVNAVLPQIRLAGIERVCLLTE